MAYNAIAHDYDSQLAAAQWIRQRLWERMDILFPSGSRILDVTAGTGSDIVHFIERDISVVACDISRLMLDQLRAKQPMVTSFVADFNHLGVHGDFDGIVSTFGGLSTSADLRPFMHGAAQSLRPGGILFIHLLNRWPLLDITRHLAQFRWPDFWGSVAGSSRTVNLGGISLPHYLYSPLSLYREVFARHFHLNRIEGQGIIRPLGSNRGNGLEKLERRFGSKFPLHSFGVFFSMELTRV